MIGGAAYSLMKYTSVNTLLDVELKAVTRKRAVVSSVRCAAAAAARSIPTCTLTTIPQKAPTAPRSAAVHRARFGPGLWPWPSPSGLLGWRDGW